MIGYNLLQQGTTIQLLVQKCKDQPDLTVFLFRHREAIFTPDRDVKFKWGRWRSSNAQLLYAIDTDICINLLDISNQWMSL